MRVVVCVFVQELLRVLMRVLVHVFVCLHSVFTYLFVFACKCVYCIDVMENKHPIISKAKYLKIKLKIGVDRSRRFGIRQ